MPPHKKIWMTDFVWPFLALALADSSRAAFSSAAFCSRRLLGLGRKNAGAQTAGRDHARRAPSAASHGLAPGHLLLVV